MNGLSITEAIRFIKACEKASKIAFLSESCKEELVSAAQEIQRRLDIAINNHSVLN